MDPASFLSGRTRETKIRRDDSGRWFNDGVPITHPNLLEAFDGWLSPAPDGSGRWCLSNAINWAFVEIEGPPRFVRTVELGPGGRVSLSLSDGRTVPLDADTLREGPDGALYCDVPEGLVARFDRHAVMKLEAHVDEDEEGVHLQLGGRRVRPPRVADPLARR